MSQSKEIYRNVLWSRGILSWKFHSGQELIDKCFNNVQSKLCVVNCARRLGKTYWAVTKAIETAIQKDNARIVIASAFQTDVEEFIVPIFKDVLSDCPSEVAPKFNSTKKKYQFNNGSEIQIVGLDKNPNAGRGKYCDLYIFEEAGFISEKNLEYIYSSVVMPMTMYRDNAKIIMISTPPKSPSHPFKEFVEKAKQENAYIKLDVHQNPRVTPEIIEEYRKECLTETDWQREYLCEFVTDSHSAIIPEWSDSYIHESNRDEFYKYYHKYVAMDLGVKDYTALIFGYYDFKNATLVIEDELLMNGPEMTTEKLKDAIVQKESEVFQSHKIYRRISDNNNLLLIQDLATLHGIHFGATNKETLDAMVNELRIWVSKGRVKVNPKCKHLIGCLKYGVWNDKRTEFARSTTYKHFDGLAALIYLIRNIDQTTNPVPITHGYNTSEIYYEKQETNQTVKSLKQIFNVG